MDLLCSVNWIALLVLAITLLLFKVLNQLAMKINWTCVVLISMVMGAVIGLVFASDNNSYLVWVDLIGDIYINVITALVAPVILISIMSGFISLNSKEKMKSIGLTSVLWLHLQQQLFCHIFLEPLQDSEKGQRLYLLISHQ